MSGLEKFERTRKRGLVGVFISSLLLFASFLFQTLYSFYHFHKEFPYQKALNISAVSLVVAMAAFALWRNIRLRHLSRTNASFRLALKDERVKFNWLKAYRLAFFVLLVIQILSKLPLMVWRAPWEVPAQSVLSLSAAVTTLCGAFLYYDRERSHE